MKDARAEIFNEDCIAGMSNRLDDDTVDLVVSSIPFEELFTYSGKSEDVGNNGSTVDIRAGRFALNMRFVVDQLFRVVKPGRNVCIHIQQLLAYKNQHGFMGRRDFRGAMVDVFGAGGFLFAGEFAIQKDPQAIANRMNLHSLQFKSGYARDSGLLAPVFNDYVLIFRKPGDSQVKVRPLIHSSNPKGWVTTEEWIRDAHGIWTDIMEIDVLQDARSRTVVNDLKENSNERHVCPLQLEVLRRLINLYTNPIDLQEDSLVLDPFMGIGSTAYVALAGLSSVTKLALADPRNVVGFELKESYHLTAIKNVARARKQWTKRQDALIAGQEPLLTFGKEEVAHA